ncbi:MAG: membrane or secreted protein [Cytophagales bacterium]|nr:membrane or secreted protein [Cytophagales bacterium]
MKALLCILGLAMASFVPVPADELIDGAWQQNNQGVTETRIYANGSFASSTYDMGKKEFAGTFGGKYTIAGDKLTETIEFDTRNPERIGTTQASSFRISKGKLTLAGKPALFNRVDQGEPGQLAGAWLITGRVRDGKVTRSTPGARRTMKILSGTRFQWIAYNVDTKEMLGTGGGTYTTVNGKYTENIEFFSRDNTRVGASLGFEFSLVEGEWHHSGLSSKGEPINEIWTRREKVGI